MNILLVDDDTLIRKWLSLLINQLEDSDLCLYEADNGEVALEICDLTPINLVITDICMPGIDGVTLLTELRQKHPDIRTAVLSAYDDFQYIRSALQQGALDYIPKAEMTLDDLSRIIEKAKQDVKLEKNFSDKTIITEKYSKNYNLWQEYTSKGDGIVLDFSKQFCQNISDAQTVSVGILWFPALLSSHNISTISSIWENLFLSEKITGFMMSIENEYIVFFYCSNLNVSKRRDQYTKIITLLHQSIQKHMDIALEKSVYQEFRISDSFSTCAFWVEQQIYYQLLWNEPKEPFPYDTTTFLTNLQLSLSLDDIEKTCGFFKDHIDKMEKNWSDSSEIQRTILSAKNILVSNPSLWTTTSDKKALDQHIKDCPTLLNCTKTKNYINKLCNDLLILSSTKKNYSSPVSSACEYVRENYSQPINLNFISSYVFLSHSYFSQLFKKETGVSFGEYLENIRIQQAKILLRTSNKTIEEIAEGVGFSNQNYFTRIFKKNTEQSPLKYRKTNR